MAESAKSERQLTLSECAVRLGVSEQTIRRAINQQALPSIKVGRMIRVEAKALDEYVDARRIPKRKGTVANG